MKFSKVEIFILIVGMILSALSVFFYEKESASQSSIIISLIYIFLSFNRPLDQQLLLVSLALSNTKALNIASASASVGICALSVLTRLFRKDSPKLPLLILVFFLYCLQYYVRFENVKIGVIMPLKAIVNMIFFWYLCNDAKIAKHSFDIGVKSAIAIYLGILSAVAASIFKEQNFARLAIIGNDPNMLAVEAAFTLAFICTAYYSSKVSRFFFFSSTPILCLVVFYCGSRMGWLLVGFVFIYTSFLNLRKVGKMSYFFAIVGITALLTLNSSLGRGFIERMDQRMENLENKEDVSNGRIETWNEYIDTFNSDPVLWLIGLGDYKEYGIEDMAHNFFFEQVASDGLIGFFMTTIFYLSVFVHQRKHSNRFGRSKIPLQRFLPLLIPLIGGMTLHGLTNIMNTTMLYLGVLCLSSPTFTQKKYKRFIP